MVRLNKYLALSLGVSRREADELIEKGRVTVNDTVARLGYQLHENEKVAVDGKRVESPKQHTYIALNKPVGYVCSRKQQGSAPTIYSLLPTELHSLKPVGRLDKDSAGLLLLTNDGDFAHTMTHPKFYKTKVYFITLDKELEPLHQQMINDFGVQLDDGSSKLTLEKINDSSKEWRVTMSEGRNRQIRRTFAALGYSVKKLYRTRFGSYDLAALHITRGEYREVKPSP